MRGLEVGRYKSVDDLLAHNVEAFAGMQKVLFGHALARNDGLHYEFLDNDAPPGQVPRSSRNDAPRRQSRASARATTSVAYSPPSRAQDCTWVECRYSANQTFPILLRTVFHKEPVTERLPPTCLCWETTPRRARLLRALLPEGAFLRLGRYLNRIDWASPGMVVAHQAIS
jgi:hypothetical protein